MTDNSIFSDVYYYLPPQLPRELTSPQPLVLAQALHQTTLNFSRVLTVEGSFPYFSAAICHSPQELLLALQILPNLTALVFTDASWIESNIREHQNSYVLPATSINLAST